MPPKVQATPTQAGAAANAAEGARPKVSRAKLGEMKKGGERIVMVTAYDYPFARLADAAGVDILLVGDTLGMVVLGFDSTLPVTMEHMVHHTQAVSRARPSGMIVGDMPFMSYQVTAEEAVRNAGRLVQEGGAEAVKLEGGERICAAVEAIASAGIPVMGHIGLTPQAVHQLGGYRVQGRDPAAAERLVRDAHALQESGCFALVLEAIPASVAQQITTTVRIPTIGIGAGPHCDGQVLVLHDLLGLFEEFVPKFVRRYADLAGSTRTALEAFADDVRSGRFPGKEHSYG
ncbi:MAG: 3-methyl-2-oxobutanoate hydroxymethyltransferase [Candidatus Latescibacterota bacterium]|nr:MAG: 3-methyl-2-oxobutanoate hydroxymethyltransferase [Candidatus Latescibacterota bacterium]